VISYLFGRELLTVASCFFKLRPSSKPVPNAVVLVLLMSDLFRQGPSPIDEQYHVNIHNDLVLARIGWSLMMHRIMMVLVSRIDSQHQDEFETQYIRVKNLMEITGNTGNSQYDLVQEAARRLIREPVEVMTEGSYSGVPLFSKVRYESYQGLVSARFHEEAEQYLLRLSKRFTSWRLDQTIPLTTSYAIRHYMIGKWVERRGRANSETISVGEYRKKLKCEDKYSQFADLKRRVIKPSLEQVNEETDLRLDYHVVRDGRTPTAVKFTARPSGADSSNQRSRIPEQPEIEEHTEWLHEELSNEEFSEVMDRAKEWAKAEGYDRGQKTWKIGVDMGVRKIYRERADRSLTN
jgi:plasmid replication initiation protein